MSWWEPTGRLTGDKADWLLGLSTKYLTGLSTGIISDFHSTTPETSLGSLFSIASCFITNKHRISWHKFLHDALIHLTEANQSVFGLDKWVGTEMTGVTDYVNKL